MRNSHIVPGPKRLIRPGLLLLSSLWLLSACDTAGGQSGSDVEQPRDDATAMMSLEAEHEPHDTDGSTLQVAFESARSADKMIGGSDRIYAQSPDHAASIVEPDTGALRVEAVEVQEITATSALVEWTLTEAATGQIYFGTSTDYDRVTRLEDSFEYSTHRQRLRDLEPNTEYHLQIESMSASGAQVRSGDVSFRTAALPTEPTDGGDGRTGTDKGTPPPGWPASHDQNLPMAGIFYGNHQAGALTGNSRIAVQHSRRFRAERDGQVLGFRYNNRVLLDANISGRCKNGNRWCQCKNAGLDAYTCGYTLGNSYSVGNGGRITVELREDDGTSRHEPSGKVLARTRVFVPMDVKEQYPLLRFTAPVNLKAGKLYHLVYLNSAPPSRCGFGGVPVSRAGSCPRNEGAIGLNGVWFANDGGSYAMHGPFRGKSSALMYRNSSSEGWTVDQDNLSWYELLYADGMYVGDFYNAYNAVFREGKQVVEGNRVARQKFRVRDATREVNGLWLNYGHDRSAGADGSPLSVALKDSSGNVLARGSLPASQGCIRKMRGGSRGEQECREWKHTSFDRSVSLLEGSTYTVEFKGGSASGYVMSTYFPKNYGSASSKERGFWHDARAEISSDGGRSWRKWHGDYYDQRDLGLVFTIVGMPRQLD